MSSSEVVKIDTLPKCVVSLYLPCSLLDTAMQQCITLSTSLGGR
jgi:hypothetical protein